MKNEPYLRALPGQFQHRIVSENELLSEGHLPGEGSARDVGREAEEEGQVMLTGLLSATAIGVVMLGYRWYTALNPVSFAPDMITYSNMSKGRPAPDPFRLRWLLPALMPEGTQKGWKLIGLFGLLASFPALYLFAESAGASGLWAVMLWGSLPVIDVLWRMRGIVDHVSWPVALVAAAALLNGWTTIGILLVVISGMLDPRLPVFVAAWTLNPLGLLGLIPAVIAHALLKKGQPYIHPEIINHPWQSAKRENGHLLRDPKTVLLPWGACLFGILNLSGALLASLLIAYGQMICAIDRVRLYMWAAPVLIVATLGIVPEVWLPLAVIVTIMNPWRPMT